MVTNVGDSRAFSPNMYTGCGRFHYIDLCGIIPDRTAVKSRSTGDRRGGKLVPLHGYQGVYTFECTVGDGWMSSEISG